MRSDTSAVFVFALVVVVCSTAWASGNLTRYDQIQLALLKQKCVGSKFKGGGDDCDAATIVKVFGEQHFNFLDVLELRRFAAWIELMTSVQYYAPQATTLTQVAAHLGAFARIDGGVTRPMQVAADALYYGVANFYANHYSVAQFRETWIQFQNFFNSYIIWAPARFRSLLSMYSRLRESRLRYSRQLITELDEACARLITLTLEYPLSVLMPQQHVRQEAYIYYVSKLPKGERKRFDGLHEAFETQQFPQTTVLHSGPVNITVHHDIHNLDTLNRMQEECDYVYGNFLALWRRLNVSFVHTVSNVDVYVYNNRSEYRRTGLLITNSVDNGGSATYHPGSRRRRIHSSVYFEENIGGNDDIPRAFGHEMFHCLLYSTNRRVLNDIPNAHWFSEGAANRFGYRKCFWRDYFNLRTYENRTIREIVRANYGSDILYPMGSALVSFLYEKRPEMLREAVLKYNYTIVADDRLEREFSVFKRNKLAECDYVRQQQQQQPQTVNAVQTQYSKIISTSATFRECRNNYMTVRFNDCEFVLTPSRLYLENGIRFGVVNAQKTIRYNRNEVTQFDFDFLQKGLIKLGVRHLLNDSADPMNIADKYFSVDDKYSYEANVSCGGGDAIVSMLMALPMRASTLLSNAESVSDAKSIVRRLEEIASSCQVYTPPPVNVTGRLRTYVEHLSRLTDEHIALVNLIKPLDVRGNTIVHLAAVLNRPLFLRLWRRHSNLTDELQNYNNRTPRWMFDNTLNYIQRFKHPPGRYCMSIVKGNFSLETLIKLDDETTPINNETTNILSPKNNSETPNETNANNTLRVYVEKQQKSSTTILDVVTSNKSVNVLKYSLLSVTIVIVVIVVAVIPVNTIITLKIVKHHIHKASINNSNQTTEKFNKHKFYNNECTIPLFN
ncbi:agip35 [Agrotis ipsilon multiple nucleopolyhedrovirus]|uniref:Uncharacterized protein n=1 Tax=Agrotis ipsilon multiple nucleopolyhedrovirus TaxID=208013 RepID=B6D5U9_9ABAC|nr:agip35 [Agrotis ipsilon multiple nucleopolyhedrovirus]ACI28737.1 unknown [Agrotis ipsilon multiple nucleopolyhedrovirus]